MERIRNTSPYFLAAFAIIFIGFMVASDADIDTLLRQGQNYQTAVIATVNGEPIYYRDFEQKVQDEVEKERTRLAEGEEIDDVRIRKQLWNQLVEDILLRQEAEKAGIHITDEEIRDIMIENPPRQLTELFTDSTGFNKQAYLMYLTEPNKIQFPQDWTAEQKQEQLTAWRNTVLGFENQLREQKLKQAVTLLSGSASAMITDDFAKQMYINENSVAGVDLIFINATDIPNEQVNVTDKEIQEYYEKYKHLFKEKDMRRVRYVVFKIEPSASDSNKAELRIKQMNTALLSANTAEERDSIFDIKISEYNGKNIEYTLISDVDPRLKPYLLELNKMEISGPLRLGDSRFYIRLDDKRTGENTQLKASHILIEFGEDKDAAKVEAERIKALAQKGLPFDSLAQVYSKDPGSGSKGGDLGYFTKGKMVPEFEEAAFATDSGKISGPIETQFGWHIIKVTDKIADELKWSEIEIKVTTSTPTKNQIFRDAFAFQKQIAEGADFMQTAEKLKLSPVETPFFNNQRPILGSQYITDMAFQNKPGFVLEPLELQYHGVVVVQVAEERSKGIVPLEDKTEDIKKKLALKKKVQLAEKRAKAIHSIVSSYGSLKAAVDSDSTLTIISDSNFRMSASPIGLRKDVLLNYSVFSKDTPLKKVLSPIKGENGWYIVQVNYRELADLSALPSEEIISYKKNMQKTHIQRAYYDWFRAVREKANIEDKRSEFYKYY